MSTEIVEDDDNDLSADDIMSAIESRLPDKAQTDARRRIEELMERRRLKSLLNDPYREDFEEDLRYAKE